MSMYVKWFILIIIGEIEHDLSIMNRDGYLANPELGMMHLAILRMVDLLYSGKHEILPGGQAQAEKPSLKLRGQGTQSSSQNRSETMGKRHVFQRALMLTPRQPPRGQDYLAERRNLAYSIPRSHYFQYAPSIDPVTFWHGLR